MRLTRDQFFILSILSDGESYGVKIADDVNRKFFNNNWLSDFSLALFYSTIFQLEREKLVTSRYGNERLAERGGARRRYYSLTGLGEAVLNEELNRKRQQIEDYYDSINRGRTDYFIAN